MKDNQPLRWIVLGIIGYLILAIVTAPASLLFRWIAPETVQASKLQGTVWRGSAERIVSGTMHASDVSWSFKPFSLLTLKAAAEVQAKIPGGQVRGDVASSLFGNNGSAKNIRAVIKLEELGAAVGEPLLVNGTLGVILQRVAWKAGQLETIIGNVTLADLSDTITATALGTFEIEFPDNQGTEIRGIVRDVEAIFTLNGAVTLGDSGLYQFDAVIEPTADTPESVLEALPVIGAEQARDGSFALSYSGSIYAGR